MLLEIKIGNQTEIVSLNEEVTLDAVSYNHLDYSRDGSDSDLLIKKPEGAYKSQHIVRHMTRVKKIGIYALI
jgi:hypothetical protein